MQRRNIMLVHLSNPNGTSEVNVYDTIKRFKCFYLTHSSTRNLLLLENISLSSIIFYLSFPDCRSRGCKSIKCAQRKSNVTSVLCKSHQHLKMHGENIIPSTSLSFQFFQLGLHFDSPSETQCSEKAVAWLFLSVGQCSCFLSSARWPRFPASGLPRAPLCHRTTIHNSPRALQAGHLVHTNRSLKPTLWFKRIDSLD